MSDEILSAEEIVSRRIRRIIGLIANRTDYGTFEDEEAGHLDWLLRERDRLLEELTIANRSIQKLTELHFKNEPDGDDL